MHNKNSRPYMNFVLKHFVNIIFNPYPANVENRVSF
jgi:hypothetical protein